MDDATPNGSQRGNAGKSPGKRRFTTAREGLKAFIDNPSAAPRLDLSESFCEIYSDAPLTDRERGLAEEILRDLAKSVELPVREILSRQLKDCGALPHDIALMLAEDVESVALPVLRYSEVLTDDDLVAIVRRKGVAHQTAIANRAKVTPEVSAALIAEGSAKPVFSLLKNEGAEIDEAGYDNVIRLFPQNQPIKEVMAERPDLPIDVVSKLVEMVSDHLQFELVSRYGAPANLVHRLMQQGSEVAIIAMLTSYENIRDAEILATQLYQLNRLSPSLMLRALYLGQIDFLEMALSCLGQVSLSEVRRLLLEGQNAGFRQLYRRARLPAALFQHFRDGLARLRMEVEALSGAHDASARRVVASLLERGGFDGADLESSLTETGAG